MMLGGVRNGQRSLLVLRYRMMVAQPAQPAAAAVTTIPHSFWFSTTSSTATNNVNNNNKTNNNDTTSATTAVRRRWFRRTTAMDDIPSYRDFLHRQSVLRLYRQFLRTVKGLSEETDLSQLIKKEFQAAQHEQDPWNQKRAVQEGQRRFKDLQATVSTSAVRKLTQQQQQQQNQQQHSPDSNHQDVKGEDSKVGKGWPWERKNNDD